MQRIIDIPGLSLQAKETIFRQQQVILKDLHDYYRKSGKDIAVRFGNLVLLMSPIKVKFVKYYSYFRYYEN